MTVLTSTLYCLAFFTCRFNLPKNFVFSHSCRAKSFPSNAPIDAHSAYVQLRKIMAEACGIDTIYHAVGVDAFSTFGAKPMDDCIGNVRRRLRECILHGKAKCANNLYRNIETSGGTVQKTHSVEKRANNTRATITRGSRERWKLYATKTHQIN